LFSGLIAFTESQSPFVWQGYFLAVLLFFASIFQTILMEQHNYVCAVTGMSMRSAIIAAVYKKVRAKDKDKWFLWRYINAEVLLRQD